MKTIKCLILSFLLLIGVLSSGEIYQYYLDDFSDAYTAGFVLPDNDTANKNTMISDIESAAISNHVYVFLLEESVSNVTDKIYHVYCSENTKEYLSRHYCISEGTFKSFICGSTSIFFHDIFSAPDEFFTVQNTEFHISGSLTDARNFKSALVNQYYGGFPQENYSNKNDAKSFLYAIWFVVLLLAVCVMMYFVLFRQKEITVRCILGEKSNAIYAADNIHDTLFLLLLLLLMFPLAHYNSSLRFLPRHLLAFVLIFMILIWVCSLKILSFNVQKALKNIEGKTALLIYSYAVKCFSACLTTLSICAVIPNIQNAKSFYSQEPFFLEHANGYYYYIYDTPYSYEQGEKYSAYVRELFYRTFYHDILTITEHTPNTLFTTPAFCPYLEQAIPEFSASQMNAKVVYLMPESYDMQDDEFDFIRQAAMEFIPSQEPQTEQIISYRTGRILSIDPDTPYKSLLLNNPVICIINMDEYSLVSYDAFQDDYYDLMLETGDAIICAQADAISKFAAEYGVNIRLENAYQSYLFYKSLITYTLYLSFILGLFFILFEFAIIRYIINLEYEINAKEIAVKKILGYRNYQCILKLFIINVISSFVGLFAICIVMHLLRSDATLLIIPFLLFLGFEILITNITISKKCKKHIPSTLKGGAL